VTHEFNQRFGETNGNAKLTQQQVDKIRTSSLPNRTLANQHGVTIETIEKIKKGKTWPAPSTSTN